MSDQQQDPTYADLMHAEVVRLTAALERAQRDYESANRSLITSHSVKAEVAEEIREYLMDNSVDNYSIPRETLVEWVTNLGGRTTYEVVKTYEVEITFEVELGEDEPSEYDLEVHCSSNNAEIIDQSFAER